MRQRLPYAGFGILATLVGMAVGHLVASLLDPASSPVVAVGSTVIDLTPTPVKEWAVQTFGTADKPILIGSVMAGAALLAAIGGVLARRRFVLGAGVLVGLVAVAGVMALLRPTAGVTDALPALATGLAGVATLWWLTRSASPAASGEADGPTRRGVLVATGAAAAAAAVAGGAGWLVGGLRRSSPAEVALPAPTDPAPAFPDGLGDKVPGISPFRTPTADFYRIDTRLTLPTLDIEGYELVVDGDVEEELRLSFEDLTKMDLIERDITLTCVSNDVGGPYVGGARWLGVRLTDVLDMAGVGDTADQILATDVDGMTISTPLSVATDGRDAMIAIGMNGGALPREHGFPVRMVVPGLYGFVSACKWMTKMTLTTYDEQQAYWTERGWATDAPIKISSRIDTPKSFQEIDAGETFIGGVAWAQDRGIGTVEVQIDGGQWQQAELGPSAGVDYWRQWFFPWNAESGEHTLAVRAVTREGEVQTPAKAQPFPDGSSGYQSIIVRVA
ncbi:molybdopterin-dependent oxidoreductase [Nocardioides coralli]|uniref:molybdopterin-dependent oxidoreductase n=1 Tax=Nocardioides coralli TaxID=2872154 RepID=UPI001CA418F5|nr:molybdopterin-dependent oxidoreductase [Nocardioides coralli]QZY29003.1 molybdopterin-dependent oxidoreductase [Nocardioides coralli]